MPSQTSNTHFIQPGQLRIGLYVHLDLGWLDHPFSVSNFKISDESQIETIQSLGLSQVRYDPIRSSVSPLHLNNILAFPLNRQPARNTSDTPANHVTPAQQKQLALKQALHESEQKFLKTSAEVRQIQKLSIAQPTLAFQQATTLVEDLVSSTLTEGDIAMHAMNSHRTGDQHYQHELNTLVLSMMLAKTLNLSNEETVTLGMAAILHDIGKRQISDKILLKKEPLTMQETTIFKTHVLLGLNMLKHLMVPKKILTLIAQHHEFCDGSGYPQGLLGEQIDPLAHILVIANGYDNLCNPANPQQAKSPYEALGMMFAQQRHLFDQQMLRRFIKCLGIYPPGSVVRLSDHRLATVISTNPQQPLRPFVQLLPEPALPTEDMNDGQMLDLREAMDINITQCVKSEQLPTRLLHHLPFKQRMSYFLDKPLA